MAAVKLQPRLIVLLVEIERRVRRNAEQRRIGNRSLRLRMEDLHRVLPLVELVLEELVVLFFLDIGLILRPERLHRVQRADLRLLLRLRVLDGLAVLILRNLLRLELHLDRIAHIVGVFLHEALDLVLIRKVLLSRIARKLLRERDRDGRAALFFLRLFDCIVAVSSRLPFPSLPLARLARYDSHLVRYHERRIEADAELTDHLFVIDALAALLRLLELLEERLCTGLCDRTDILDELLFVHADAIIGNRKRMALLVRHEEDLERVIPLEQIAVREALEMRLVDGVGSIRDELPQKDLVIRVNAVNHEVKELLCLRLKFMRLFCHSIVSLSLRCHGSAAASV